jgi:fucose 4-O-acetylase-like acetyltransferase
MRKHIKNNRMLFLTTLATALISQFLLSKKISLPWSFAYAIQLMYYYSLGYFFKILNIERQKLYRNFISNFCLIVTLTLCFMPGSVNNLNSIFGLSHLASFVIAPIHILGWMQLAKWIHASKFLQNIGKYSISIFALHIYCIGVFIPILLYNLKITIPLVYNLRAMVYTAVSLLILLPVSICIEYYLSLVSGKSYAYPSFLVKLMQAIRMKKKRVFVKN